jgi:hypothetical protein
MCSWREQLALPTQSTRNMALPSLSALKSLRREIIYYSSFRCIDTFDIPLQSAVKKQWRYIGI